MSDMEARRVLRVGLTQFHATRDIERNVQTACRLVAGAASDGADLVLLPENCLMLGTNAEMRGAAFRRDSSALNLLSAVAAEHRVTVVLGGAKFIVEGDERPRNRALIFDPTGRLIGGYDKIHLFDARIDGQSFEASSVEQAGGGPVVLDIAGTRVGITICYDVRFPELYRRLALAGAEVILVPAAFTRTSGRAHWEVLLRARAIENAVYIVASATIGGAEDDAFPTYGHASVVGPWGEVLADLGEALEAYQVVELNIDTIDRVREQLPVLRGVRPDAYGAVITEYAVASDREVGKSE
jgi:predicted amidohydrolase